MVFICVHKLDVDVPVIFITTQHAIDKSALFPRSSQKEVFYSISISDYEDQAIWFGVTTKTQE